MMYRARASVGNVTSSGVAPVRGRWYFALVIGAFLLVAVSALVESSRSPATLHDAAAGFWVLVVLAILADTPVVTIQRPRAMPTVLTSITFCYSISYIWGYGSGRVTQAAAIVVASIFARRGFWPTLFDIGRYGLALATASWVFTLLGRPRPTPSDAADLIGVLVAALAWYVVFRLLTATGTWLCDGGTWARALIRDAPVEALSATALLLLAPMLVLLVYTDVWLIPLILAPLFAVSRMSRYYSEQQERALRDQLTGLPNRLALSEASEEPLRRCTGPGAGSGIAALLVADIAQMGRINDALGHDVGDRALVAIGRRLGSLADSRTLVGRLQGDEFAVLMWDLADLDDVLDHAARVRAVFDGPVPVDSQPLTVHVAMGIAVCPAHGTTFDVLARRAYTAMERAKRLPDPLVVFRFDQEMPSADQLTLLDDLRRALDEPGNHEVVPFWQPQVDMATGQVIGVEALLRWRHPTRGLVSPEHVIRVAEHSPVMRKITMTMIEQVLAQLAAWRSDGLVLRASLNVSVRDLYSTDLVEWLETRLRHYAIAPSQIQLELTESALMSQTVAVLASLRLLRRFGAGAALDDFGTGFSSLQHLRQLPLTEIKIDRTFTARISVDPPSEAIVRAVVNLGRELGLRVVAEGVEDDETRARLLADGCRLAQGWYYAGPMPADDLVRWLTARAARTSRP
ncbi:MAG TPA: bifunctional diguanylate cyclase/phosphodiesterase [Micromonosporaceae bacterium]